MDKIKEIDVVGSSTDVIFNEIKKLTRILIGRYNEEVGQGWDEDMTYTNNDALSEEDGDDYDLSNETTVSYYDDELDPSDASGDNVENYWECVWTFDNDNDGFTIDYTMWLEDGDDIDDKVMVDGDYEVAYWWAYGAYVENWIPTEAF